MEIKEVMSYYLNSDLNILEVSFRTIEDDDEVLRTDNINYKIAEEYGFELETESFDFFDDNEDDDNSIDEGKIELDEEQLILFLNEYYMVNPKSLPKANFF